MQSASVEERDEYLREMLSILQDHHGRDRLAEACGLHVISASVLPGFYKGMVNPSYQVEIAVSERRRMDRRTRDSVELYCAAVGLLLGQESVAYHQPYKAKRRADEGGVRLDLGRPVTIPELIAFHRRMGELFGDDAADNLALVSDSQGVRVLNYPDRTGLSHTRFHQAVKLVAVETIEGDIQEVGYFAFDGGLVYNDWEENPDGKDFVRTITSGGSPDLLRTVSDLGERIREAGRRFAARHGWDRDPPGD